jgi:hypothetical protein
MIATYALCGFSNISMIGKGGNLWIEAYHKGEILRHPNWLVERHLPREEADIRTSGNSGIHCRRILMLPDNLRCWFLSPKMEIFQLSFSPLGMLVNAPIVCQSAVHGQKCIDLEQFIVE